MKLLIHISEDQRREREMLALKHLFPFSVLIQSGSPGHGLVPTDLVLVLSFRNPFPSADPLWKCPHRPKGEPH